MTFDRNRRPGRLVTPLLGFAAAAALWIVLLPFAATTFAAVPQTYYVNCSAGNDARTGTTKSTAWRSLTRANKAQLHPGDRLLLRTGCTWTGPLEARWSGTAAAPITVGSYGSGKLPIIKNAHDNILVSGSHLVFDGLMTTADPPGHDPSCDNQPIGWVVGWRFLSGSAYNVVVNSKARDLYMGVFIAAGSHDNQVLKSKFVDDNVPEAANSTSGGMAIVVYGDNNEIAYNQITGSDSCSHQYGRDGSAVEIYGGQNNNIHHNRAIDNNTFVELGNSRTAHNTIAYNVVTASLKSAVFLVARGANDGWGPTVDTRAYNNSVYLTGDASFAVVCGGNCNAQILTFKNNIVWSRDRVAWVDGAWAESNNIWWSPGGPRIWFTLSRTSLAVDPRYVNPAAGNLSLQAGSPAINAGTSESISAGYRFDYAKITVPERGAVDIGAFEMP
jgi:hypothetical protein